MEKRVRRTSIEAYNRIKEDGLLSERRWQVYDILYEHGPATGNELLIHFRAKFGTLYGNSPVVTSRLGELRDLGVAYEVRERDCEVTTFQAAEWDVTENLPIKFEKEVRHRCPTCNGKGYLAEQQARFDI